MSENVNPNRIIHRAYLCLLRQTKPLLRDQHLQALCRDWLADQLDVGPQEIQQAYESAATEVNAGVLSVTAALCELEKRFNVEGALDMECPEWMKPPEERETDRDRLIRLTISHLNYVNQHPSCESPWSWREEILYLPDMEPSSVFYLYRNGEIVERFVELHDIELFARGMLCLLTIEQ